MSDRCKLCGPYALNLARHGIDQGDLCDVHYWQGRAEKDAERYRWIRRGNLYQGPRALWFDFSLGRWEHTEGEALDKYTDEAIDASVAKERT